MTIPRASKVNHPPSTVLSCTHSNHYTHSFSLHPTRTLSFIHIIKMQYITASIIGFAALAVAQSDTTTAPATTSSAYACNPAHSYPNGQTCVSTNGAYELAYPATTAAASSSAYACNPAHSYPNGQTCVSTNGAYELAYPTTTAAPSSSAYACNPAHSYPNGQSCSSSNGGYFLVSPITAASNGTGAAATVTEVVTSFTTYCPAATTLTFNDKVYTVTAATTLTITDCPCTITKTSAAVTPTWTASHIGNSTKASASASASLAVFQGDAPRFIAGGSSILAAIGSFFFLF